MGASPFVRSEAPRPDLADPQIEPAVAIGNERDESSVSRNRCLTFGALPVGEARERGVCKPILDRRTSAGKERRSRERDGERRDDCCCGQGASAASRQAGRGAAGHLQLSEGKSQIARRLKARLATLLQAA